MGEKTKKDAFSLIDDTAQLKNLTNGLFMKPPSNKEFIKGFTWQQFTTVRSDEIKELNARYIEVQHIPTGASIVHIQNDDPENLFCLSFRTLPSSSNGIAHVLEHTVLCGSQKFPVRDPFFSMIRRSLHTYMNALTGADCTCYPAASQSEKDFYQLLDVYLDSVFFPKLDRLSFLQEGHRLEFESDATSPLVRKGVVYNEMKGALSSPMTRLHETLTSRLFPDVPYGYNSGGDPKDIPSLTLDQLKEFHKTYYHPSRCLFYFYGNFSLANHLQFLEETILNKSQKLPALDPLPKQRRFTSPIAQEMDYPATEVPLSLTALGWLTYPCTDVKKMLALAVVDSLLMETDASPLKRYILDKKLAQQVQSMLHNEIAEAAYMLILTGTQESKEVIEKAILEQLDQIAKEGFSPKEIERALHQFEIQKKEIARESGPFGLTLFWRSGLLKQQGIDPLAGLEIERYFNELHQELSKNPRYLSDLLKEALLDNPHRVLLKMNPSETLNDKEMEEEKKSLQVIEETLSKQEKQEIINQAEQLKLSQEKEEDLSCLPNISLQDISRKNRVYTTSRPKNRFLFSNVFTNHITYVDIAFELSPALFQKPHFLRLFSLLFAQMGYGELSWEEALQKSQEYTGGVFASISLDPSIYNANKLAPFFHLHGSALSRNLVPLLDIMSGYIHDVRMNDTKRLEELLKKQRASLETSLIPSSLHYATLEAAKNISLPSHIQWQMAGRDYLDKIRFFSTHWKSLQEETIEQFSTIKQTIFASSPFVVSTCSKEDEECILNYFSNHPLPIIQEKQKDVFTWTPPSSEPSFMALQANMPISFSSFALPAMTYGAKEAPFARLLSPLANNTFLHTAIREQGGAYGGGASYNSSNGLFSFYTYRDPNIWKSYKLFQESLSIIAKGDFTEEDLNEAKRECIQSMDEPLSPSSVAQVLFHREQEGKTEELRQQFRESLLDATHENLTETARFFLDEALPKGSFVTVAGPHLLAQEKKAFAQEGLSMTTGTL